MKDMDQIQSAFERHVQVLRRQPDLGQKTGSVTIKLEEGLRCRAVQTAWHFASDMSRQLGGSQTAPSPGFYVAAALGSCLAIMAKMWAAKLSVILNSISVTVTYETDMRMLFGLDDVPARWKSIQYSVEVDSPATDASIRKVLEAAHRYSHVRGDLEHAFRICRMKVQRTRATPDPSSDNPASP